MTIPRPLSPDDPLLSEVGLASPTVLTIETELRGYLAARLIDAAKRRRTTPIELLADIIETVLKDDLIAAVGDG